MPRRLNLTKTYSETTNFLQYNIADLIADWCESLHGGFSFSDSLRHFLITVGAEAGMIVRIAHENSNQKKFLEIDLREDDPYLPKLKRSYASCVLREYLTKAQSSRLWLSSQADDTLHLYDDPSLAEWQSARSMRELIVIVLSTDAHKSEFLELHFRELATPPLYKSLEALLPTMCRAWSNRTGGLFSVALQEKCNHFSAKELDQPILSCNNPAQLSRSEFRVCMLLSTGLSIASVASELSVCIATVRSHLRAIYSKTNTSGHAELVFRLLSSRDQITSVTALSA